MILLSTWRDKRSNMRKINRRRVIVVSEHAKNTHPLREYSCVECGRKITALSASLGWGMCQICFAEAEQELKRREELSEEKLGGLLYEGDDSDQ